MEENIDNIQPKVTNPEIHERTQKIDKEEAMRIVMNKLRAGEVVLMGDYHYSRPQHLFFASLVEKAGREGISFAVGLELSYTLEDCANTGEVEEFIKRVNELSSISARKRGAKSCLGSVLSPDLPPIIGTCKKYGIPIICMDVIDPWARDIRGTQQNRNAFMAERIQLGERKYKKKGALIMVGQYHILPQNIPAYLDKPCATFAMDVSDKRTNNDGNFNYVITDIGEF